MLKPSFFTTTAKIPKNTEKKDLLRDALHELFFVEHSHLRKNDAEANKEFEKLFKSNTLKGVWVYYPWKNIAIRLPSEDIYFTLRTARNRNLITKKEQIAYRKAIVGVAGLSVGSAVISSLVSTGGPHTLKIADFDTLEITNLNRIRASLRDVGRNKADIAAQQIYELDPFADVRVFDKGLLGTNLEKFLMKPKLDVFIDEMDDIELKVRSREMCRQKKIPVVMATDNGDSIIVDVERFDLEPTRPLFHGRIKLDAKKMLSLTPLEKIQAAITIIDPELFTEKQQDSMLLINKELSGVPQLATAAVISGAAVAYVARKIMVKEPMPSGRYIISCEAVFTPGYNSSLQQQHRKKRTKKFADTIGVSLTKKHQRRGKRTRGV